MTIREQAFPRTQWSVREERRVRSMGRREDETNDRLTDNIHTEA